MMLASRETIALSCPVQTAACTGGAVSMVNAYARKASLVRTAASAHALQTATAVESAPRGVVYATQASLVRTAVN